MTGAIQSPWAGKWESAAVDSFFAELRAAKAARDARPAREADTSWLSPELVAAGIRHARRIGRLNDHGDRAAAMRAYWDKATADIAARGAPAKGDAMSNVVQYQAPAVSAPAVWRGVQPADFDSAIRMAKAIAQSGMAPKSYYQNGADPVAAVFTAMQLGAEVGLTPMAAVQNIAVINGRPGMFGPAMLAVVEASGKLADIEEIIEGEGDARAAVVTVTRVGRKPRRFTFSMADARKAKLTGKPGPWSEYPDRMLLARARTFALRDVFPDILLGLASSVEELQDIPAEPAMRDVTPPEPKSSEPPLLKGGHESRRPPLEVRMPDAAHNQHYPRNRAGLISALDFIGSAGPGVVALNDELLSLVAERLPELADRVEEIRAAATMELMAAEPAQTADPDTGEVAEPEDLEPDKTARKMAGRRGGAATDEMDEYLG